MQPVQDLTVEDTSAARNTSTRSRTRTPTNWRAGSPQFVDKLKQLPELRDVASDQQNHGLPGAYSTIDRQTASRLGITTQTIDDTLYDAFGQRQSRRCSRSSTSITSILEVMPEFQTRPGQPATTFTCISAAGRQQCR